MLLCYSSIVYSLEILTSYYRARSEPCFALWYFPVNMLPLYGCVYGVSVLVYCDTHYYTFYRIKSQQGFFSDVWTPMSSTSTSQFTPLVTFFFHLSVWCYLLYFIILFAVTNKKYEVFNNFLNKRTLLVVSVKYQ